MFRTIYCKLPKTKKLRENLSHGFSVSHWQYLQTETSDKLFLNVIKVYPIFALYNYSQTFPLTFKSFLIN